MDILTAFPYAQQQDIFNCPSWQSWAGSAYQTNVHVIGAEADDQEFPTPFWVIQATEESMETRVDTANFTRGSFVMWVQDTVNPCCADETSAYNQFCGHVGAVIKDLNQQGITATLFRRGIRPLQRPWRNKVNETEQYYSLAFVVTFGLA
ncbi:MAG TPA: hypothetical protein VFG04_03765 [Planctomycetaceae bacterium]|nr:hypothetical protein [Planctomycetaceae bacterium]